MSGSIRKDNGKYGYTLVELLVVIALFAIVFSICIPSTKIIANFSERRELREFKKDIIFARNSAVIENSVYVLYIDIGNNGYKISKEIGGKNKVIKDVKFEKGNKLKGINFKSPTKFYPTGSPSMAGKITLTNTRNDIIEITITPATGKVNLHINRKGG